MMYLFHIEMISNYIHTTSSNTPKTFHVLYALHTLFTNIYHLTRWHWLSWCHGGNAVDDIQKNDGPFNLLLNTDVMKTTMNYWPADGNSQHITLSPSNGTVSCYRHANTVWIHLYRHEAGHGKNVRLHTHTFTYIYIYIYTYIYIVTYSCIRWSILRPHWEHRNIHMLIIVLNLPVR